MTPPVTGYLDFDCFIGTREDGGYLTRVLSPGGEPRAMFQVPFSREELERRRQALAVLRRTVDGREVTRTHHGAATVDGDVAEEVGKALFTALLGGPLATAYRLSRDRAQREGKGLRIRLRIESPEVAALPWELLYDDADGDFVGLTRQTALVRYLDLDRPSSPIRASTPLRVLGMIALPDDVPHLDAAQERERIEQAFSDLSDRQRVELQWVEGQTWRHLQHAMRSARWNVFHFVGHGSAALEGGSILLAGEDGKMAPLAADELGRLLAGQASLGLVVLNACEGAQASDTDLFSSSAATLVRRGLPAVIAMQHEVSDGGAISFARDFYAAISDGLPVDGALTEARIAASLERRRSAEWATPVLFMRAPDGRLFDLGADSAGAPATAAAAEEFPEIPGVSARGWAPVMIGIGVLVVALVGFLIATS